MKKKISISIDSDTLTQLEKELKKDVFRSKSHLVEFAIKNYLGGMLK